MSILKQMNKFEMFAALSLIIGKLCGLLTAVFIFSSITNHNYRVPAIVFLSLSGFMICLCIFLCFVSWNCFRVKE